MIVQIVSMANSLIGLNFEGGQWFFNLLNSKTFISKEGGYRWSDQLWQLPTYLTLNYLPGLDFKYHLYLLSYVYTLHPLVSLIACYFIAKSEKQSLLMIFPIISLATAVSSNITFVVGIANGAISIFWPVMFILYLKKLENLKYWLVSFILILLLSFNYETSILLFPLLGVALFSNRQEKLKKFSFIKFSILAAIFSSFIFQFYRIILNKFNTDYHKLVFWNDFFQSNSSLFSLCSTLIAFLLLLGILIYLFSEKTNFFKYFILFLLAASIFWVSKGVIFSLMESRNNRTVSIPIVFLIAISFVILNLKNDFTKNKSMINFLLSITTISLFVGNVYIYKNIKIWNEYLVSIESILKTEKGCVSNNNFANGNSDIFSSILLQKKIAPETIIFSKGHCLKDLPTKKIFNPCSNFINTEIYKDECGTYILYSEYINLTKTKSGFYEINSKVKRY